METSRGDAAAATWIFHGDVAMWKFCRDESPFRRASETSPNFQQAEPLPATAALSWGLGCYSFDACKGTGAAPKPDDLPKFASLVVPDASDAAAAATALRGTYLCRDLINAPAGDMGPAELEAVARDLAASAGASMSVVEGDDLLEGYPQIHAVGRAAGEAQQPRLLDIVWGEEDAPKVARRVPKRAWRGSGPDAARRARAFAGDPRRQRGVLRHGRPGHQAGGCHAHYEEGHGRRCAGGGAGISGSSPRHASRRCRGTAG